MKTQFYNILITITAWFLFSSISHAAFISVSPTDSPLSLTGANGNITVTYSPTPASEIWFSNSANGNSGDVGNQNQDNVGSVLESTFGLDPWSLSNGDTTDSAGGGNTASFTSTQNYDYLAVHFGKHELFFHFASSILAGTTFSIQTTGKAAGISNFRSYSVVPIPAAVWLLGTGVLGIIGLNRRRINQ